VISEGIRLSAADSAPGGTSTVRALDVKVAVGNLENDRKKIGMKTAEMYQIAESRGVDELRAKIESAI